MSDSHKVKVKTDGTLVPTYIPGLPAFNDEEGQTYRVITSGGVLTLTGVTNNGEVYDVAFFKADALKIIALIAEAAK